MSTSDMSRTHAMHGVVRMREIYERVGLRRSAIYNKLNPRSKGFDPSFPRPIPIGARAIGWLVPEIEAWVASRTEVRDGKGVEDV